jgi:B9 domain-containing protein 2
MESLFRTPQVHLIGEVVGASGFTSAKLYAKVRSSQWHFKVGPDWRLLSGTQSGETFYDTSESLQDLAVFEHPIDAHYACKSLTGWPKLFVEVRSVDSHQRHTLAGYGVLSVPCAPGQYELEAVVWRPEGSAYQQIVSYFIGANPELQYKDLLFSGNDRFGLQTISTGVVLVRLGVVVKDFGLHGVLLN